jgi:hypothetical protein
MYNGYSLNRDEPDDIWCFEGRPKRDARVITVTDGAERPLETATNLAARKQEGKHDRAGSRPTHVRHESLSTFTRRFRAAISCVVSTPARQSVAP